VAGRRHHPSLLRRRAAFAVVLASAATLMIQVPADAHNQYGGAYRKWPWKGGQDRLLTTLPGECPHCPGVQSSSAWKAIDAALYYETVYSIGPGRVERYEPSGGGAGKYLRIKDADGTFFVYEHLSQALVTKGSVVAGQPIAVSGCTGNCNGAHLHFQRNDAPSFSSDALRLTRISGHGGDGDRLTRTEYLSDNAGVGYTAGGNPSSSVQAAYADAGGYQGFGVTADIGKAWSPCRAFGAKGTWWRYGCNPRKGVDGSLQTYFGPRNEPRAIMHPKGSTRSWAVTGAILAAYTELTGGYDWVFRIGYPTANRFKVSESRYRQNFEEGWVLFVAPCEQRMYIGNRLDATYGFCE